MRIFSKNHRRCDYEEGATPPFPVRQIPARDLRRGMTLVLLGDGAYEWGQPSSCCGRWPVVTDNPRYRERGEGGEPCVYWTTDESGMGNTDRSPHYWVPADLPITIAAGAEGRNDEAYVDA